MKKEYKVYKIENIMNDKVYIGYTSLSLNERLHKHYTNALYGTKSKLYDSIRKNGISNFKLSQLFSSDSKEEDTDEWKKANEDWKEFWFWKYRPSREGDSWSPTDEENYFTL